MSNSAKADQWTIEGATDQEALQVTGALIDHAFDEASPSHTTRAFSLLDELAKRDLTEADAALLHYFRANAWENRRQERGEHREWSWEQQATQDQLLELRRCIRHGGFPALHPIRRCQILTNLGNLMNSVGRFVEAIDYWDRALAAEPNFAMALGNKALGLKHYALTLYDGGHTGLQLLFAYDSLGRALSEDAVYESYDGAQQRGQFTAFQTEIAAAADISAIRESADLENHSLGETEEERAYRQWCLEHRLFLNPLNDLGALPIAAQDILTLPSLRTKGDAAMPEIIGLYNQMKQEYASARYMYYQGCELRARRDSAHYADKGVLLYNTLDYPVYGLAAEQIRVAYRMAYSLFDKCSYFLNAYFDAGHAANRVNFRNVWYYKRGREQKLARPFRESRNWPLRGLFWLSKDFFDPAFKNTTAPDAEALDEIRHHIEHKYLHLTESAPPENENADDPAIRYALSLDDFSYRCLQLLGRARAVMIYLSLAVHMEERRKLSEDEEGLFVGAMPIGIWDDDWKL